MGDEPAPCPTGPRPRCVDEERPWLNWARNQEVYPRCLERPRSLCELQRIVREVSDSGGRLRAVATGLSFSDILQTDDTLVVVKDLTEDAPDGTLLPLESELWSDPTPAEARVRVICGARLRHLNQALDSAGLAFPNLGGYDGQTLIGALSTSTHGSGISFGPFCDLVRSLDLVSTFGKRYRIEPTRGITNPARFKHRYGDSMQLVQNDDWFYSVVVSLGCMGVIHCVTFAVTAAFDLEEHRYLSTWKRVRDAIASQEPLKRFRHYEVLVNPYRRRDGEYTCLVTERKLARPGAERVPLPSARQSAEDFTFKSTTQEGLLSLMNATPRLIPSILEAGLEELTTGKHGHIDVGHKIFNVGKINHAEVLSGEYFMPLEGGWFLKGIDRLIAIVASSANRGIYQTAPLALRFVKGSPAYLSMLHSGQTAPVPLFGAVEIPMFTEAHGAVEALLSYEQALYEFKSRPHWGQLHELTGAPGWWRRAYDESDRWIEVYRELNCRGVFDNHFTGRMGLDQTRAA